MQLPAVLHVDFPTALMEQPCPWAECLCAAPTKARLRHQFFTEHPQNLLTINGVHDQRCESCDSFVLVKHVVSRHLGSLACADGAARKQRQQNAFAVREAENAASTVAPQGSSNDASLESVHLFECLGRAVSSDDEDRPAF